MCVQTTDPDNFSENRCWGDLGEGFHWLREDNTPSIGPTRIERGELFEEIQKLSHPIQIKLIVACRGTERFRVPKRTIAKEAMAWRRTLCVNRADGTIVDAGLERWVDLTKAQQIRKAGPARLSLTIFGQKKEPSQSSDPRAGNGAISELPGLTLGRSPEKDLGWAPPPIALSGPQFRDLATDEREGIRRLHNNLGHPDPQMFAKFLKERGAESRIVEGALHYQCSTCTESKPAPVAARPSTIHKDLDFNDVVGADGAHWQGQSGETFHFMHLLDESTLFHVGAVSGRTVQEQIRTFEDTWLLRAGPCETLYLDPAGEYVNDTWATYLQSEGIKVEMSAGESPWQLGRCERHGRIHGFTPASAKPHQFQPRLFQTLKWQVILWQRVTPQKASDSVKISWEENSPERALSRQIMTILSGVLYWGEVDPAAWISRWEIGRYTGESRRAMIKMNEADGMGPHRSSPMKRARWSGWATADDWFEQALNKFDLHLSESFNVSLGMKRVG